MRPRKSLSQNFLIDDDAARRIVEGLDLTVDDTVLEIGPGKGALTGHLLERAGEVFAVEIDRRLCHYLKRRFRPEKNLRIVCEDILKLDPAVLMGHRQRYKVVGNLPYKITSPVISLLLEEKGSISLCVLMVQREVASRICAEPGNRNWSSLSIAVQLHSDARILFHLRPSSFSPSPRVESSVIRLTFLGQPRVLIPDEEMFFKVVHSAFGQRRKMVLNSLAGNLNLPKGELEHILKRIEIDPGRRPETLSIREFADLTSALSSVFN